MYTVLSFVLVLFFAFLLATCSSNSSSSKLSEDDELENQLTEPFWLKVDERFSFTDGDGNYLRNPFFDNTPFIKLKESSDSEKIFAEAEDGKSGPATEIKEQIEIAPLGGKLVLNFFVTTPVESDYSYDFDLISGKLFSQFSFCSQKDVWKTYKDELNRPMFTSGVVPRILDQLGTPQKIIVFGNDQFFKENFSPEKEIPLYQAKIVGGVVEQYCEIYPCSSSGEWLSRQVLVAVSVDDPKFFNIENLDQLKKVVNWREVVAFLENRQGRSIKSSVTYINKEADYKEEEGPAYRYIGEISLENVISYTNKNGHIFDFFQLESMRKNCHKLYDYLWETASQTKLKKIKKEESADNLFAKTFGNFLEKYGKEFTTCSKYVRVANVNQSAARHWFFTFLTGFVKLNQLGHIYFCDQKVWMENIINSEGKLQFNPVEVYQSCSDKELSIGLNMMGYYLNQRYQGGMNHLRYISYDEGIGRTHSKIYSWVYMTGKKLSCSNKEEMTKSNLPYEIFPEDIKWNMLKTE